MRTLWSADFRRLTGVNRAEVPARRPRTGPTVLRQPGPQSHTQPRFQRFRNRPSKGDGVRVWRTAVAFIRDPCQSRDILRARPRRCQLGAAAVTHQPASWGLQAPHTSPGIPHRPANPEAPRGTRGRLTTTKKPVFFSAVTALNTMDPEGPISQMPTPSTNQHGSKMQQRHARQRTGSTPLSFSSPLFPAHIEYTAGPSKTLSCSVCLAQADPTAATAAPATADCCEAVSSYNAAASSESHARKSTRCRASV